VLWSQGSTGNDVIGNSNDEKQNANQPIARAFVMRDPTDIAAPAGRFDDLVSWCPGSGGRQTDGGLAGPMRLPMSRAVLGLARLTLLEARRTAVGKAALAAIAIAVGLALFVDRVVLTDQERATVVTYAVIVRLAVVLTLGLAIIANTVRDLNERIIDNFLALPLTRMQYALGKWLGWSLSRSSVRCRPGCRCWVFEHAGTAAVDLEFRGGGRRGREPGAGVGARVGRSSRRCSPSAPCTCLPG